MSLETRVQIRRYESGVERAGADDLFLRRDYDKIQEFPALDLTSGVKTELQTMLSAIEFLYVSRSGDEAAIEVYKGLSPESYSFDDTILIIGWNSVTSVSLKADSDTTVYVYLAGS